MTPRPRRRSARPALLAAAAGSVLLAAATLAGIDPAATAAEAPGSVTPAAGSSALTALPITALLAGLATAGTTATGTAAPAAAAPADTIPTGAGGLPTLPYNQCTDTTGVPYATGLPPLPCFLFPYQKPGTSGAITAFTDNGSLFSDITQDANKPRVSIGLPDTVSRIFSVICTAPLPGAPATRPCPDALGFQYPTDSSISSVWLGVGAFIYVQSPLTATDAPLLPQAPQFGVVAQVRVPVLAFGSIPGTAVLTVRQATTSDGYTAPIVFTFPSLTPLYPQGTVVPGYEQYGANPGPDLEQLVLDAAGTGAVTITVSDVTIDTVPLDVGTNCSTSTDLNLYAQGGWVSSTETATDNEPGEYRPFNPPGYLHAKVDVPAFSGCVGGPSGTEDLSPLITGLVSSAANQLDLTQVTSFTAFGCLAGSVKNCTTMHPAVVPPEDVVNRSDSGRR